MEDGPRRRALIEALAARGFQGAPPPYDSSKSVREPARGILVDICAADLATRIAEIARLRASRSRLPVLAIVTDPTREVLDTLHLMDVSVCASPLQDRNLDRFLGDTNADDFDHESLRERVHQTALRKGLSRREKDLLLLATSGMPRKAIAGTLSVSENTVKAQIRSLLRKTGARSLAVLGQQLLRGDAAAAPDSARVEN